MAIVIIKKYTEERKIKIGTSNNVLIYDSFSDFLNNNFNLSESIFVSNVEPEEYNKLIILPLLGLCKFALVPNAKYFYPANKETADIRICEDWLHSIFFTIPKRLYFYN